MNLKEKTNNIFHSTYKIPEHFKNPEKAVYDNSDVGYRKFKTYNEFTKKFDTVPFTSK
jgi:hypothetical protein